MNYNVTHSNTKNWNTNGKYWIKSKYIHSEQGYPLTALIYRIPFQNFAYKFYDQIQWLKLDIDIMFVFVDEFKYALLFLILAVEILKVN